MNFEQIIDLRFVGGWNERLWSFLTVLSFASGAWAQNLSMDRHVIAGGSGTSAGGVFSVSGSIGQPAAGTAMTNGQFSVSGGFWELPTIVQTPGAPFLSLTSVGTNAVLVWSSSFPNWALEESANSLLNAWSAVSLPRSTNSGQISVIVPMNAAHSGFRLKKL
jgi:hypothetical protein